MCLYDSLMAYGKVLFYKGKHISDVLLALFVLTPFDIKFSEETEQGFSRWAGRYIALLGQY